MRSIQRFLLGWLLAALACISLVTFGWSYSSAEHEVEELYDAELAQYARIVEDLVEQSWIQLADTPRTQPPVRWPTQMEAFGTERTPLGHAYERKLAVQIWSVDRRLLMRTIEAPDAPFAPFAPGYQQRRINGTEWHVFSLLSQRTGRWIMVGERGDIRDEVTEKLTSAAVVPYLAGLLPLLILSGLLIRRALRPLIQLSSQLRSRDAAALSPVALDETPREMAPVTEALNTLLAGLAQSLEREQRLTSDAAHELRTPLTVLALHARNALDADSEEQRRTALIKLEAGIVRSQRLLDQLLTYARVNRHENLRRDPQDLGSLARSAVAELYPLLHQRQQQISVEANGRYVVPGQPLLLETLICNLLDNASRYSPQGSRIELRLFTAAHEQVLEVHDSGPGIAPDDRDKALRPFQRLDSGDAQGAGLGLAIVGAIAHWHGGRVELDQSPLGGLLVRVTFPVASGDT